MGGATATGGVIAGGTRASATSTVGGSASPPSGGQWATGGAASGGAPAVGGAPSAGGVVATGGTSLVTTGGTGGATPGGVPTGGAPTGGVTTGGVTTGGVTTGGVATGGAPTGGVTTGGVATGGASTGGVSAGGAEEAGGAGTAGVPEAGGAEAGAGGSAGASLDCGAPMPTGNGTTHCGSDRTGRAGDLAWELWSNANNGNDCITYYDTPAFSARWNNNGDFLARLGIEWGGRPIAQLGEITAEFTYRKTGSSGEYSYIGVYGWATNPCVEYYIIDDSFNGMPFSPWGMQQKGSATIDGEVYRFFSGTTGGTGGSRCAGGGGFTQYWSVRQRGRSCGVINVTKHFEAWRNVGMNMDNILEAKVLVETGGGQGTVEFPIANVRSSR